MHRSPSSAGRPGASTSARSLEKTTALQMESSESRFRDERVFQRLMVTLFPLGILGLLAWFLVRGESLVVMLQAGAALAALFYVAIFLDITLGLAILILCTALSPEISIGGFNDLRLEDFLVPALALSWAGRSLLQREPLAPTLIGGPALLAVVICLVATLAGAAMGSTTIRTATLHLVKYGEYLLIYLLFLNNVRTRHEFRALASFALIAALVSAFTASSSSAGADHDPGRLSGPHGETANIFGGYLAIHVAIALGVFLQAPGRGARLGSAAAAVGLAIPLLYTYSRTSVSALVAACAVFALLRERRLFVVLGVMAVCVPLLAPESIWTRITTISGVAYGTEPSSWASRLHAWQLHLPKMLGESPLLGFGIASLPLGELDNEYVRVLIDTGLLGFAVFLWILVRLGRAADRLHQTLPSLTIEKGYAAGYWIAFWTFLVHAVGSTSFTAIRTMESFMVLSGLFAALHHRAAEWLPEYAREGSAVLVSDAPVLNPRTS